jgi:uncharacterized protein YndB with AHSA1/START domain
MHEDYTAVASIRIYAPAEVVWNALLNPDAIRQFMFGTQVISDFHEGHPITWQGEWQGKCYEDKGMILKLKPLRLLKYTHYSPLSGKPDRPANYHTVTIELTEEGPYTRVSLTQDNNETMEARVHSEKNWASMLASLKKLLESSSHVSSPHA